jgi:RNA polymerase sigma-70 factor, ECF subfamily
MMAPLFSGAKRSTRPLGQSEQPDHALVEGIRSGDQGAFEVVFRRYYEPLWRFTIGYVESRDVARELVHDVFFRIGERRDRWTVATSLGAYLYSAARNAALNHLRHVRQDVRWQREITLVVGGDEAESPDRAAAVADAVFVAGPARAPDEVVVMRDEAAALRRAVLQLPERQRQALVLRWYHGLTHPEVAAVLGVTVKAVESLMVRGMASLRGRLANLR